MTVVSFTNESFTYCDANVVQIYRNGVNNENKNVP